MQNYTALLILYEMKALMLICEDFMEMSGNL